MSASGDERLPEGWLSRAVAGLPKLARALLEEVLPLARRKTLAEVAQKALPQQAFNRTRTAMWRAAGVTIGANSLIQGPLRLTGIGNTAKLLSVGVSTMITGPLHLDLGAPVHIGDWVRVGHDVSILTISHEIGPEWFRAGTSILGPVEIGDGAWIASRVVVLPGVKVGRGAVVAAGAVVVHDVPAHTLVAGVPARVVRELER